MIGGGETASLISKNNHSNNVHISTGGGALLEYLENKVLHDKNIVGIDIFI